MGQVYSIACGLPFCSNPQETQTNLSIGLRIAAVVLGIIAAIVGILVLYNVPGLSQFGTTAGWTIVSIGTFLALVGESIKCIKKQVVNNSKTTIDSTLPPREETTTQVPPKQITPSTPISSSIVQNLLTKEKKEEPPKSLEEAIKRGLLDDVERFISNGADVGRVYDEIPSSTHISGFYKEEVTALHLAAKYDKEGKIIEKLIESGLNVNTSVVHHYPNYDNLTGSRSTSLHYAAYYNSSKIVQLLIDKGANINAKDECFQTPLHSACKSDKLELEEQLRIIDCLKGADVNAQDCHGTTAIHHACTIGRIEVFDKLLAMGADVSIYDKQNFTALRYATGANGNIILIERLIDEFKLDVNQPNEHGQVLLDFVPEERKDIIELLLEKGAKQKS